MNGLAEGHIQLLNHRHGCLRWGKNSHPSLGTWVQTQLRQGRDVGQLGQTLGGRYRECFQFARFDQGHDKAQRHIGDIGLTREQGWNGLGRPLVGHMGDFDPGLVVDPAQLNVRIAAQSKAGPIDRFGVGLGIGDQLCHGVIRRFG